MDMVPDDVATELRDRKHILNTVDTVVQYRMGELSRNRDKEISSMHDTRAEHALDSAPRDPVNPFVDAEHNMKTIVDQMESMVAAFAR